jgi:hypothetical protein
LACRFIVSVALPAAGNFIQVSCQIFLVVLEVDGAAGEGLLPHGDPKFLFANKAEILVHHGHVIPILLSVADFFSAHVTDNRSHGVSPSALGLSVVQNHHIVERLISRK